MTETGGMGRRGMAPSMVHLLLLLAMAAPILGAEQCKSMACSHGANIAPNPRWRGSRGPVHYLGLFKNVAGCEEACLGYKGKKGEACKSFAYHQMEEGGAKCIANRGCYWGQCFAITDDRWDPVPAPGIISGTAGFSSSSLMNKAFSAATNSHPAPEPPKV